MRGKVPGLHLGLSDGVVHIVWAQGDQLGLLFQNLVTAVGGFVIAFVYGWRLALVVLSVVPLLAIGGVFQVPPRLLPSCRCTRKDHQCMVEFERKLLFDRCGASAAGEVYGRLLRRGRQAIRQGQPDGVGGLLQHPHGAISAAMKTQSVRSIL